MSILDKSTITATPAQVERKWNRLTEWQREQVSLARMLGKSLAVTVIDLGSEKILYDVAVLNV